MAFILYLNEILCNNIIQLINLLNKEEAKFQIHSSYHKIQIKIFMIMNSYHNLTKSDSIF